MSALLVKYVLKAAIRDKLVLSLLLLLALATSLSIFMGSAANTESDQFAAVFAAGSIRLLNVFGLCLFVIFFIRRSFESRDVEFLLTRPIGRIRFLLSYAASFAFLGLVLALVSVLCIYFLSPHLFSSGSVLWGVSLIFENIIMVSTALFFAMVLSSPALAMFGTMGFYILVRMMSDILGILDSGKLTGSVYQAMEWSLQLISMFLPRLDLMGQSSWLVYGMEDPSELIFVCAQGVVYTVLILTAALIDLTLRRF